MAGVLKAKVDGQWVIVTAAGAGGGGGAGVDEVAVSNTDPGVLGTHELWFDPDATTPTNVLGRWNSAWGIIAMGTFIPPLAPHVSTVTDTLTYPLAATLITGRRYRIGLQCRAVTPTGGTTTASFYLRDNGVDIRGWQYGGDPYVYVGWELLTAAFEWLYNGDNTSHSFEVRVAPGSGVNVYTDYGLFYIEDTGPLSYGQPPAVDPTPTAVQWTPIVPLNNWTLPGATEILPGYRKIGDVVYLKGSIQGGSTTPHSRSELSSNSRLGTTTASSPVSHSLASSPTATPSPRSFRSHHLGSLHPENIGGGAVGTEHVPPTERRLLAGGVCHDRSAQRQGRRDLGAGRAHVGQRRGLGRRRRPRRRLAATRSGTTPTTTARSTATTPRA